jgi:hypothetical protein
MKYQMYAVKPNSRVELLNRIIDSCPHIKNDDSVKRAVTKLHEGLNCA